MAKRFIDTAMFDDPWFMDLSKDGKIFWMYCITKCNHAGIIEINKRLCKFQTDIKDLETVIKELGNRLVSINEVVFFIPKFINFQYPNFPQSNVKQQAGAIEILCKYGLYDKENNTLLTVNKELPNSYGNGNDNVDGNDTEKKKAEKTNFVIPAGFETAVETWLKYKSEKNQRYKETGLRAMIKSLVNMSNNNPEMAIKIVEHSMSNNYDGLFQPKNNQPQQQRSGSGLMNIDIDY